MGRSVSTHPDAVATVFIRWECEEPDDCHHEWESFLEDIFDNVLEPKYPTLEKCSRWEGRENHVIAQNQYCEVSVSEYCGVVAICLAPKSIGLAQAWTHRIANAWHKHVTRMYKSCAMAKLGTFSNGESVYTKV